MDLEVLDLGCAKVEWIYHLYKEKQICNFIGQDYSPILVKKQNKNLVIFKV